MAALSRRAFLASGAAFLAAPLSARASAQEYKAGKKMSLVGFLSPNSASDPRWLARLRAFQQGIRELGYVEGQNIAIESRWAEGKWDGFPASPPSWLV